jgi:glyoxylase-like metal-dependent hydrolase (beta-lactamase superfamily II)
VPVWICATCASHYPEAASPPGVCVICADERQWVPASGQRWTTAEELAVAGHRGDVRQVEPGLLGIGVDPPVAIGQRALLVRTAAGNLLWDPPGYLDDLAVQAVRDAGGLRAVAASHPHFYGSTAEWSRIFDAEVLLAEADAAWLTRPPERPPVTWAGALAVLPGVTLVQCGGHFPGSAVVHWAEGADGKGVLLTGDSVYPNPDRRSISFMRSAPNRLPLPERAVRGVVEAVRPYAFDRIYGGWWQPVLRRDARAVVERSAERYIQWLRGEAEER